MSPAETITCLTSLQNAKRVLAYGGGCYYVEKAPLLRQAGLNIVGVIDKFKTGTLACGDCELPICSLAEACARFGADVPIVLTVFDATLHDAIKRDLVAAGFDAGRIVALQDIYDWLTVPSDKCYCHDLLNVFMYDDLFFASCCHCASDDLPPPKLFRFFKGMDYKAAVQAALEKLSYYHTEAKRGRVPLSCRGCRHFTADKIPDELKLSHLVFGQNTQCNISCIYCNYDFAAGHNDFVRSEDELDNFLYILTEFEQRKLLSEESTIVFSGGEAALVLAHRRDFVDLVRAHPKYTVCVLSNCAIHSEEIVSILSINPSSYLVCDLDAGTRETYLLVKGRDYFDSAVETLKRYRQEFGNVGLKYVLIPGVNTDNANYEGQIQILKDLGLTNLTLSRVLGRWTNPISKFESRREVYEAGRFKALLETHGIRSTFILFSQQELEEIDRFYKQFKRIYHTQKEETKA